MSHNEGNRSYIAAKVKRTCVAARIVGLWRAKFCGVIGSDFRKSEWDTEEDLLREAGTWLRVPRSVKTAVKDAGISWPVDGLFLLQLSLR